MAASLLLRSLFSSLAQYWERYRWSRLRQRVHRCHNCGVELRPNLSKLSRDGHHRARVLYCQLELEQRIDELWSRLHQKGHVPRASFQAKLIALRKHGLIASGESSCIAKNYGRASRVVHGAPVDAHLASAICSRLTHLLWRLSDSTGYRAAKELCDAGFVEGGAA